jgi:O-antigen/teichoic acid export membrane protein
MGKPQIAIYAFMPALVINFVLNLFLIPRYGGIGASWATNVSYAVGSIIFLIVYAKMVKMPVQEIFRYRKSDFYFFRNIRHRMTYKTRV